MDIYIKIQTKQITYLLNTLIRGRQYIKKSKCEYKKVDVQSWNFNRDIFTDNISFINHEIGGN